MAIKKGNGKNPEIVFSFTLDANSEKDLLRKIGEIQTKLDSGSWRGAVRNNKIAELAQLKKEAIGYYTFLNTSEKASYNLMKQRHNEMMTKFRYEQRVQKEKEAAIKAAAKAEKDADKEAIRQLQGKINLETFRHRNAVAFQKKLETEELNRFKGATKLEELRAKNARMIQQAMSRDQKKIEAEERSALLGKIWLENHRAKEARALHAQMMKDAAERKRFEEKNKPIGFFTGLVKQAREAFAPLGALYFLMRNIHGVALGIGQAFHLIAAPIKMGLDYNNALEESRMGLAGIISSIGVIEDSYGKLVPATERWNAALRISDGLMDQLKAATITKTKADLEVLTRTMQESMGLMLRSGIKESQLADFTVRAVQTMTALRIKMAEAPQELRGLMSGDTNAKNSRMASVFYRSNFFDQSKDIKPQIEAMQRDQTFFTNFMAWSKGMGEAGEKMLGTLDGTIARFKNLFRMAMAESTNGAYSKLIQSLDLIIDGFVKIDEKGRAAFNPALVNSVGAVADVFGWLAKNLSATANLLGKITSETSENSFVRLAKGASDAVFMGKLNTPEGREELEKLLAETFGYKYQATQWTSAGVGSPSKNKVRLKELGFDPEEDSDKLKKQKETLQDIVELTKMRYSLSEKEGRLNELYNSHLKTQYNIKKDLAHKINDINNMDDAAVTSSGLTKDQLIKQLKEGADKQSAAAEAQYRRQIADIRKQESEELARQNEEITKQREETQSFLKELERQKSLYADMGKYTEDELQMREALARIEKERDDRLAQLKGRTDAQLKAEGTDRKTVMNTIFDIEDSDKMLTQWRAFGKEFENVLNSDTWASAYVERELKAVQERERLDKLYLKNQLRDEEKKAKKYSETLAKNAAKFFDRGAAPLSDMISGFIGGGTEGMFSSVINSLKTSANRGFDEIFNNLIRKYFTGNVGEMELGDGTTVYFDNKGGSFYNKEDAENSNLMRNKKATAMKNMVGFAQIGLGAFKSGRTGQDGSITSGAIMGGLSGATMGAGAFSWVGAIVGAIVGGISAAYGKQQARDDYKYGLFSVRDGNAINGDVWNKNLNDQEVKGMLAQVQDTFDTFWNEYMSIALKLPGFLIPKLSGSMFKGDFQKEASANFLKHFDAWVTGDLPDEIANVFFEGFSQAATGFGMSQEKFKQVWGKLNTLDPKKTVELVKILFEALEGLDTAMDFFKGTPDTAVTSRGRGRAVSVIGGSRTWETFQEQYKKDNNATFYSQMAKTDVDIIKLGNNLKNLTGEAQIRGAKELADLMTQRMEAEKEYMRELLDLANAITESANSTVREWEAEGIKNADGSPNIQGQIDYWKKYGEDLLGKAQNAATPAEAQKLWDEYLQTISRIKSLAEQMGGEENIENARKWAIDAVRYGEQIFKKRIDELGESLNVLNDYFVKEIEPFFEDFMKVLGSVSDSIGGTKPVGDNPGKGGIVPVVDEFGTALSKTNLTLATFDEFLQRLMSNGNTSGAKSSSLAPANTGLSNAMTKLEEHLLITRRRLAYDA
jgi:hypothetical protein